MDAQRCNCSAELQFLIDQAEHNSPSYFDQVNNANRKEYAAYKKALLAEASHAKTDKDCIAVMARYLFFFRDEHLQISYQEAKMPVKNWNDSSAIAELFKREQTLAIDKEALYLKRGSTLEGVWRSEDGNFLIGIVKDKQLSKSLYGVIMKDRLPYWSAGQVKFQFRAKNDGSENCLVWNGARIPRVYEAHHKKDTLTIGKLFTFYRMHDTTSVVANYHYYKNDQLQLTKLSDRTIYLGIPSFDDANKNALDSLINQNQSLISSVDNLIIDIRYNLGGNSDCFDTLMNIIYTNPIEKCTGSELASVDLIKFNEHYRDSVADNEEDKKDADSVINKMKANIGHFLPAEPCTYVLDSGRRRPQKIAVLANRYTASAAEEFLYYCKQSKKVTVYGENSYGCFNYGALRGFSLPCMPYELYFPTNRSNLKTNFERTGIPPDVLLNIKNDLTWIESVQAIMENGK